MKVSPNQVFRVLDFIATAMKLGGDKQFDITVETAEGVKDLQFDFWDVNDGTTTLRFIDGDVIKQREAQDAENEKAMKRWAEYEMGIEDREEEKSYSPSNPWDAPGIKISDFI